MALFGFNKQKVLAAAEKYVQQGKLQNAISEYEKILKHDAKDLTVTNTVGDLYSRLGEPDKATECFKTVGDAYASQGFTVKAIAMYKKICKLKPSLEGLLKLAELYTQQGLFNDARAQYMQVAEEFLKSGDFENAIRILQKILEMDPENAAMRVKLADVYVRLGKKNEAWQIFSAAVESMRSKGSLTGAEEVLQRMLALDPTNAYALLIQGRILLESGDAAGAVTSLQKVSDIDSNKDGLRDLLKAYLLTGQLSEAGTVAGKLLTVHNDLQGISHFTDALMQAGQYENALQVFDQHADRLLAENPDKVLETLHAIISHVRENPDSLQKLLDLFHKAGETTHVSEVMELLAHASVQAGDLPRARDLYQRLAQIEPQNPLHMQNYQQVVSQLGGRTNNGKLITPEEAAVLLDDLEATAPSIHQHYSDETALAVRSALTDAELFISYNMPAKALGPLTAALPLAPKDLHINQRLASLHTRSGHFAEAALCCRTLQSVYSEAEYPDEATRYGELAARYEERASAPEELGLSEAVPASMEAEVPEEHSEEASEFSLEEVSDETSLAEPQTEDSDQPHTTASPWPTTAAAAPEGTAADQESASPDASASEIDVSSEWDDAITIDAEAAEEQTATEPAMTGGDSQPADSIKIDETIEEIRFYLAQDMAQPAAAALGKLENLASHRPELPALRAEVEAAVRAASERESAEPEVEELSEQDIPAIEVADGVFLPADSPAVAEMQPSVTEPASIAPEPVSAEAVISPEPAMPEAPEPEVAESSVEFEPAITEAEPEPAIAEAVGTPELAIAEAPVTQVPVPEPTLVPEPAPVAEVAQPEVEPESKPGVLQEMVTDIESSLGENFLPGTMSKPAEPTPVAAAQPESDSSAAQPPVLGKLVAEIESSLGDDFLKVAPAAESQQAAASQAQPEPVSAVSENVAALAASAAAGSSSPSSATSPVTVPPVSAPVASAAATPAIRQPAVEIPAPQASAIPVPATPPPVSLVPAAPPASASASAATDAAVDLAAMFGELKQDLEDGAPSTDDDPETHYNLGIAFREMGLIDEAIGELQKACMAFEHGHPFQQILQTYTWLANCFLEKNVPEAAVRWYDKALSSPNLDGETRMALTYELASAHEAAGDKPVALKHFLTVYGTNIDYRDVAERIRVLKS